MMGGWKEVLHHSWRSKDYGLAVWQYLRQQLEPLFVSNFIFIVVLYYQTTPSHYGKYWTYRKHLESMTPHDKYIFTYIKNTKIRCMERCKLSGLVCFEQEMGTWRRFLSDVWTSLVLVWLRHGITWSRAELHAKDCKQHPSYLYLSPGPLANTDSNLTSRNTPSTEPPRTGFHTHLSRGDYLPIM